jgi:hypothetical protein
MSGMGLNGAKIRCGWGWFLHGKGHWDSPRFQPRTPTQTESLCYIALRSVEQFVEMLPEGSSARPPLPRHGVSVA